MAVDVEDRGPLSKTLQVSPHESPARNGWALQRGEALGRYLIIDVLGRGGMSVVYAAFDPELDRKVAIKVVRPELEGGAEATARLLREAQAMAKVLHPNVVSVHDVGTWEGRVFLAMELIDGTTLREWLKQQRRTRREVLALFRAAGQGLSAAHAAGLVHRDFKPDNVLVDKKDRARVTDFGLVRPANASAAERSEQAAPLLARFDSNGVLTEAGAVLGTPAYMAPEQLLGNVADARADQFAFAVALYEALYGERPFEAKDFATTFEAVTKGQVRPPPAGSRVPGHLRRVLLRALSVDPEQRFPSMQALLTALEQDPVARLRRLSVGLAIALLALSGPGFALWRAHREAHRCEGTVNELDGIWDPSRRAALERVLSAPGVRQGAREQVIQWADRYAAHWKEARLLACEGVRAGRDDARLVAASGQCVEARRLQLKAVLDLLLTSDADALELAERAFSGVGDAKACVGLFATPGPQASTVDAPLIEQLARARARIKLGRISEGEADANAALKAARERGQLGLAAAAQLELGQAQYARGNMEASVALFREALLGAEATGESELEFETRLALSRPLSEELERYEESLWVLKEAEAVAQRLSLPPERIATLLFRQASALEQAGRSLEALPLAERSLALSRQAQVPSSQLTPGLLALANLHSDLGHLALSSRYYEEYLAAEATSGLRPAIPLSYSGEQLVLVGEFKRGLERLQRARAALAPIGGAAIQAVLVEGWIAFAAASLGDLEVSQAAQARAIARRGELTQPHHVAELLQMLAWVDLYQGRLASSARRSREALSVLRPVAAFNQAAVLENSLGLAEALRRQGHSEDALQVLEAAIAEAEAKMPEYELGLTHARGVRVGVLRDLGRAPDDAARVLAAASALETRELGAENPDLTPILLLVGREALAGGRTAEGLAVLERALKLSELRPGDLWGLAEARLALAGALADDPASSARATALALAAQEALRSSPEVTPLSAEVARFLRR